MYDAETVERPKRLVLYPCAYYSDARFDHTELQRRLEHYAPIVTRIGRVCDVISPIRADMELYYRQALALYAEGCHAVVDDSRTERVLPPRHVAEERVALFLEERSLPSAVLSATRWHPIDPLCWLGLVAFPILGAEARLGLVVDSATGDVVPISPIEVDAQLRGDGSARTGLFPEPRNGILRALDGPGALSVSSLVREVGPPYHWNVRMGFGATGPWEEGAREVIEVVEQLIDGARLVFDFEVAGGELGVRLTRSGRLLLYDNYR